MKWTLREQSNAVFISLRFLAEDQPFCYTAYKVQIEWTFRYTMFKPQDAEGL